MFNRFLRLNGGRLFEIAQSAQQVSGSRALSRPSTTVSFSWLREKPTH